MLGGFIKKTIDWWRKLFRRNERQERKAPVPIEKALPEGERKLPESFSVRDDFVRARCFLLKEDRLPAGRSRRSRRPDIRCIPVRNFTEAYCFFIRLCDQRSFVFRQAAGILHYEARLSGGTVLFDLTDKIRGKPPGTLAVLKINKAALDTQIAEIEFIQTKK